MSYNLMKTLKTRRDGERGTTLVETLVALALLGIIVSVLLGSVSTSARTTLIADERATAEGLAWSQPEYVKGLVYVPGATEYPSAPVPSGDDYASYSVNITSEPLDNFIQKVTVIITHFGEEVFSLESYKVKVD